MSWREARHARLGPGRTDGARWWVRPKTPGALPALLRAIGAEPWRPIVGEPEGAEDGAPYLIDIGGLDALRSVDPTSGVAHVEGGCTWGSLERRLLARGLTLGPVPRWLAGRTIADTLAGRWLLRPSPRYGSERDGLLAVRAALPTGITDCAVSPRRATGPDLGRTPLGADHRAGLITDVHLRVWPLDTARAWRRLRFRGWDEARAAAVALWGEGLRPAWWCLRRARREVALDVELHGPSIEGQLERFDRVIDGLEGAVHRDDDQLAAEWAGERFWHADDTRDATTLSPVAAVAGAELAAGIKGITKAEVWDLRPEGATIYVPREAEPPAVDAAWSALADRVFDALNDGSAR